jgi:hypothetical protein
MLKPHLQVQANFASKHIKYKMIKEVERLINRASILLNCCHGTVSSELKERTYDLFFYI